MAFCWPNFKFLAPSKGWGEERVSLSLRYWQEPSGNVMDIRFLGPTCSFSESFPESMWDLRCMGSSEGFQHSSYGRAISGDTASRNQNLSTAK